MDLVLYRGLQAVGTASRNGTLGMWASDLTSCVSDLRKYADVIFSYTNRNTDVTEKHFVRVECHREVAIPGDQAVALLRSLKQNSGKEVKSGPCPSLNPKIRKKVWAVKEKLWRDLLLERIRFDPEVSLIDSFPVPVCRFARAYRCRILAEESAFGYDEMSKQPFYGLQAHLRVACRVIVGVSSPPPTATTSAWLKSCSKVQRAEPGETETTTAPTLPSGSSTGRSCVC